MKKQGKVNTGGIDMAKQKKVNKASNVKIKKLPKFNKTIKVMGHPACDVCKGEFKLGSVEPSHPQACFCNKEVDDKTIKIVNEILVENANPSGFTSTPAEETSGSANNSNVDRIIPLSVYQNKIANNPKETEKWVEEFDGDFKESLVGFAKQDGTYHKLGYEKSYHRAYRAFKRVTTQPLIETKKQLKKEIKDAIKQTISKPVNKVRSLISKIKGAKKQQVEYATKEDYERFNKEVKEAFSEIKAALKIPARS
jgi:hypothetical protein